MGPDEFHSHVDNNAFTNRLARGTWRRRPPCTTSCATEHPDALAAVADDDRAQADGGGPVAGRRRGDRVPPRAADRLIEQFTGYFDRARRARHRVGREQHAPLPGRATTTSTARTPSCSSSPTCVMLLYLLPDEFTRRAKRANFEYYEARTLHKSSLSPSIHAIMGIEVGDTTRAVQYFARSALVDLTDNQGNTAEGMHIASAGGTWQVLVCGFGGFRVVHGQMSFRPWLPDELAGDPLPAPVARPARPRHGRPRPRRAAARRPGGRDRGGAGRRRGGGVDGGGARQRGARTSNVARSLRPAGQSAGLAAPGRSRRAGRT